MKQHLGQKTTSLSVHYYTSIPVYLKIEFLSCSALTLHDNRLILSPGHKTFLKFRSCVLRCRSWFLNNSSLGYFERVKPKIIFNSSSAIFWIFFLVPLSGSSFWFFFLVPLFGSSFWFLFLFPLSFLLLRLTWALSSLSLLYIFFCYFHYHFYYHYYYYGHYLPLFFLWVLFLFPS